MTGTPMYRGREITHRNGGQMLIKTEGRSGGKNTIIVGNEGMNTQSLGMCGGTAMEKSRNFPKINEIATIDESDHIFLNGAPIRH
jgi:hypothetical protein